MKVEINDDAFICDEEKQRRSIILELTSLVTDELRIRAGADEIGAMLLERSVHRRISHEELEGDVVEELNDSVREEAGICLPVNNT